MRENVLLLDVFLFVVVIVVTFARGILLLVLPWGNQVLSSLAELEIRGRTRSQQPEIIHETHVTTNQTKKEEEEEEF